MDLQHKALENGMGQSDSKSSARAETMKSKEKQYAPLSDSAERKVKQRVITDRQGFYFTQQVGLAENRANSLRPHDDTVRMYLLLVSLAVALMWLPACVEFVLPEQLTDEEVSRPRGDFLWAAVVILIGGSHLLLYACDCLRRFTVASMSVPDIRQRLAASHKAPRFTAKKAYLRGAKVAAVLFGIVAAISIGRLVVRPPF